jgi:hypothetical protein
MALGATGPAAALTIVPDFTSSISTASDASSVESAIDDAINTIDSLYSNVGTIGMVFTQASGSFLGESETTDAVMTYSSYVSALQTVSGTQPTNSVLSTAIANLASGNDANGAKTVTVTSADAKLALGLHGYSGCFNGSGTFVSGCGQSNYGVVTLSTTHTLNYGSSPVVGAYSAIDAVEHELNEMLGGGGQGSTLNGVNDGIASYSSEVGVLDLYRYAAPGVASFSTSGNATSYFSVDGGNTDIVGFNQNSTGDYADFSTCNDVQSAFSCSGIVAAYNASSPEYQMLESIGYDGVVPEPASLIMVATGLAGLGAVRGLRTRKIQSPRLGQAKAAHPDAVWQRGLVGLMMMAVHDQPGTASLGQGVDNGEAVRMA